MKSRVYYYQHMNSTNEQPYCSHPHRGNGHGGTTPSPLYLSLVTLALVVDNIWVDKIEF